MDRIKEACAKQDFKGEIEIHEGCEGGVNTDFANGKCSKRIVRKINCEKIK